MVKFVRPTIKRRYVFAALFVYGVVYMLAQLLSPREVDGDARRKTHRRVHLPEQRVRGVSPDEVKHYAPGKTFKCLHSSGVISYDQVNDDYCDCKDGSDEPGTSACLNGRFYCERHSAHSPKYVLSMRVNDGICDCCDGSDEWNGAILPSSLLLSGMASFFS
ncbi:hypothetical protein MRX96_058696 [Rhipicephalus microplus]